MIEFDEVFPRRAPRAGADEISFVIAQIPFGMKLLQARAPAGVVRVAKLRSREAESTTRHARDSSGQRPRLAYNRLTVRTSVSESAILRTLDANASTSACFQPLM